MMKTIINKTLFIFVIGLFLCEDSIAQYSAVELNAGASRYLDDNFDQEFDYTYSNISGLSQFNLGYSFPVSKKILLTPKVGIAFATEKYSIVLDFLSSIINDGDIGVNKTKTLQFGKVGLETAYWLKPNFAGLFFTGEINAYFNTKANSETLIQTYNATTLKFSDSFQTESIRNQVQPMVPTFRLGIGFNVNFFKRLNFFAVTHLEYRPTGYYKNTKNISHLGRTLNLGVKYVIEGGTTFLKQKEKKNEDSGKGV